jgi:hypothetical protein
MATLAIGIGRRTPLSGTPVGFRPSPRAMLAESDAQAALEKRGASDPLIERRVD